MCCSNKDTVIQHKVLLWISWRDEQLDWLMYAKVYKYMLLISSHQSYLSRDCQNEQRSLSSEFWNSNIRHYNSWHWIAQYNIWRSGSVMPKEEICTWCLTVYSMLKHITYWSISVLLENENWKCFTQFEILVD